MITLKVEYTNNSERIYELSRDYRENDYYYSNLRSSLEEGLENQTFAKVWLKDESILTLNMRNINNYILSPRED